MKKKITNKHRRVLKICAVHLMLVAMVGSVYAAPANDKQLLEKRITLSLSNVPLVSALRQMEEVTGIKMYYSLEQLGTNELVSVEAKEEPLGAVLTKLLSPYQIRYRVDTKKQAIYLKKVPEAGVGSTVEPDKKGWGMADWLTGTVTDRARQPLPGVNVLIKGTTTGTTTDAQGTYRLQVNENDVLVFSFIGYKTVEVQVNGSTTIDIQLEEEIASLNEVVVNAGYWDVKEREQTGNISRLSEKEISAQPVNNPLQAMQGRMAGVYIQQQSGVPGGSFNIQIRGQNSLRNTVSNNGNRPLYIVDGVPYANTPFGSSYSAGIVNGGNPLSNINPNDIRSIEILKDADATAIYGSRGANGVVIITTRKASADKTQLEVSVYKGYGKVANELALLNTDQYLEMRNEAFQNDQRQPTTSDFDVNGTWDKTRHTNWQKVLIGGTAHLTNGKISLSGGNEKTRFLSEVAFFKESTVFPGSSANQKVSSNFNVNHTSSNQKFKVDFTTYFLLNANNLPGIDLTRTALTLAPNAPGLFDAQGNLNWENGSWNNPLSYTFQEFDSKAYNVIQNISSRYEVAKNLNLKMSVGYNQLRSDEINIRPKTSYNPQTFISSSSAFSDHTSNTWIMEPQIDYALPVGKGNLIAIVGGTIQESNSSNKTILATGFGSDALLKSMRAASAINVQVDNAAQYRYAAMFGRLNFSWAERYFLNLTGRRDGSSRFGSGKQFANFGAVGAAWIVTNEDFAKNLGPFLSFGKVRASYGITGSDQIGDYGYMDLWQTSSYAYNGKVGIYAGNLYNPDYGWEESQKIEAALELGLLNDKVFLTLSYYNHKSSNQLVGIPLPATAGFLSVQGNFPAIIRNEGLEIGVQANPIQKPNFKWSTSLNFTIPSSKLVQFKGIETSSYRFDYVVGQPLGVRQAFEHKGVAPETGLNVYTDVNNDNLLTITDDYKFNKTVALEYFGGINNTIRFKGFELTCFIQVVKQTGYNYLSIFSTTPGMNSNQPVSVMNRWQQPGDQTDIQKFTSTFGPVNTAYTRNGDHKIGDASFLRCKNIMLAYEFPQDMLNRIQVKKANIFIQMQNVFTVTKYKGLDPETQSAALPPLRTIATGIQFTL